MARTGNQFDDASFPGFFLFSVSLPCSSFGASWNHFSHKTLKSSSLDIRLVEPTPRKTVSPLRVEAKLCAMTREVLHALPPAMPPPVHSTPAIGFLAVPGTF